METLEVLKTVFLLEWDWTTMGYIFGLLYSFCKFFYVHVTIEEIFNFQELLLIFFSDVTDPWFFKGLPHVQHSLPSIHPFVVKHVHTVLISIFQSQVVILFR